MTAATGSKDSPLTRVASNDMNLLEHDQSKGKDAFFEMELADYLRRHGMRASMDEPDIIIERSHGSYAIACKKINSLGNVEGQIKKAYRQLRRFGGRGFIALNLDVLIPENTFLSARTGAEAATHLSRMLENFRDVNMLSLQRPVEDGSCDGILFTITCLTQIARLSTPLSNYTQIDFWTLENLQPARLDRAVSFARELNQALEARRREVL